MSKIIFKSKTKSPSETGTRPRTQEQKGEPENSFSRLLSLGAGLFNEDPDGVEQAEAQRDDLRKTRAAITEGIRVHFSQALREGLEMLRDKTKTEENVNRLVEEAEAGIKDLVVIQQQIEDKFVPHDGERVDPEQKWLNDFLEGVHNYKKKIRERVDMAKNLRANKSAQKGGMSDLSKQLKDEKKRTRNLFDWTDDEDDSIMHLNPDARANLTGTKTVRESLYPHVTVRSNRGTGALRLDSNSLPIWTYSMKPEYAKRLTEEDVLARHRSRTHTKGDPDDISPEDSASNVSRNRRHRSHGDQRGRLPRGDGPGDSDDGDQGGRRGGRRHRGGDGPGDNDDGDRGGRRGGRRHHGGGGPGDSDDGDDSEEEYSGSTSSRGRHEEVRFLKLLTSAVSQGASHHFDVMRHIPKKFSGREENAADAYMKWAQAWKPVNKKLRDLGFTKAQRLVEMKRTLEGSALEAINSLPQKDESYDDAQDILYDLYNNIQAMVRGMIYKLVNMPAIPSEASSDAMRNLYAKLTTVRQRFSQLEISDADLSTLFFIETFERKLPDSVAQSWRKKVTKFEKRHGRRDKFVQLPLESFVQHLLESIQEKTLQGESNRGRQDKNKHQHKTGGHTKKKEGLIYATNTKADKLTCNMCDDKKAHNLEDCPMVRGMTPNERWRRALERKICTGCQVPIEEVSHELGKCSRKCPVDGCGRGHHALFHIERGSTTRGNTWGRGRGYRGRGYGQRGGTTREKATENCLATEGQTDGDETPKI